MTVSTIASIAAGLSRTTGNSSTRASELFTSLLTDNAAKASSSRSDSISAAISQQQVNAQFRIASQNIAQASSLLAAAESGATDIVEDLGKLQGLAARLSQTVPDSERALLVSEFNALRSRIDARARSTSFQNEKLLDGSSPQLKLASENQKVKDLSVGSLTEQALFKGATLDVATTAGAKAAEGLIKEARAYANKQLENVRALQKGLDLAASSLQTAIQNVEAARSTLSDADLVADLLGGSKGRDDAASLLAQTNRLPGGILQLLNE